MHIHSARLLSSAVFQGELEDSFKESAEGQVRICLSVQLCYT